MSQHKIILEKLNEGRWVCTNEFYASYIADPRTRICELKKRGYSLVSRPCKNPSHNHKGGSKEWYLNLATTQESARTAPKASQTPTSLVDQFRAEYTERMSKQVKPHGLF